MRLLLLLLLIATTIFYQAQQIKGLAKDYSGTPLNGATVSLIRPWIFPLLYWRLPG